MAGTTVLQTGEVMAMYLSALMSCQWYIVELLNKPACQLTMNKGQTFRAVQETRYLIDRTLHTMEHGKGCK